MGATDFNANLNQAKPNAKDEIYTKFREIVNVKEAKKEELKQIYLFSKGKCATAESSFNRAKLFNKQGRSSNYKQEEYNYFTSLANQRSSEINYDCALSSLMDSIYSCFKFI